MRPVVPPTLDRTTVSTATLVVTYTRLRRPNPIVVRIVVATRDPVGPKLADLKPLIAYGVSPRATIYISLAARAHAFLDGRDYVLPDDIKAVALDVMRHRLIVTYEADAEEITPEIVIGRVLDNVAVP